MFADLGDRIEISPADASTYETKGPFAAGLPVAADDLVVKARDLFLAEAAGSPRSFRLTLEKRLPLASGLGGGSSDAAATLALMAHVFGCGGPDEWIALLKMANRLGSDVAACLTGRAVIAEGRGERLEAAPSVPVLDAVLVNPGVALSTVEVFAAVDRAGAPGADRPNLASACGSAAEFALTLKRCRNDLEGAAIPLAPAVAEVLAVLRDAPESLIARMSGSGATCFCLCENAERAKTLARRVRSMRQDWWVRACRLS